MARGAGGGKAGGGAKGSGGKGSGGKGTGGKGTGGKGTGGKGKDRLAGRGPTPPGSARKGHPAQRRANTATLQAGRGPAASSRDASADRAGPPRSRYHAPDEIVVGRNPVVEALRAEVPATRLLLAAGLEHDPRVDEARSLAASTGVPVVDVARGELDRLAGPAPHQGMGLVLPPYEYLHPDDLLEAARSSAAEQGSEPLIVALDGVTDPRNLGSVVRSAAAFGAHGVLVPERRAAGVTAGAWKSSAGALARLPVARATNLVRALTSYASAGLMVAGLAAEADTTLDAFDLATGPLVLVVGSEGRGLSRLVGELCDVTVAIPMIDESESLNAGVAAGVALADIARRRRAP